MSSMFDGGGASRLSIPTTWALVITIPDCCSRKPLPLERPLLEVILMNTVAFLTRSSTSFDRLPLPVAGGVAVTGSVGGFFTGSTGLIGVLPEFGVPCGGLFWFWFGVGFGIWFWFGFGLAFGFGFGFWSWFCASCEGE